VEEALGNVRFRARRKDENQKRIVADLRKYTVVELTFDLGRGFPDAVARHREGYPVFLEFKNPDQSKCHKQLSDLELKFQQRWPGCYFVVETLDEALRAVGR
jgi:hypothetical protein